jgi:HKD family nuclease
MRLTNNSEASARSVLLDYLSWATHIDFAVAFIRRSGLSLIKEQLKTIMQNAGRVRVISGQDFGYTEPEALHDLMELGAEVKIFVGEQIFHPKCYIFRNAHKCSAVIGSSNLTSSGIEEGVEWNIAIDNEPVLLEEIVQSFERLWISDQAQYASKALLDKLVQQRAQIMQGPKQKEIAQKLDVIAEGFQFEFVTNPSFLKERNHPLTIRKKYYDLLDRHLTAKHTDVNVYSKDKCTVAYIYRGVAGYGRYYQLRIQGDKFKEIEDNFQLNQRLSVEVKIYKGIMHVYIQSIHS